MNIEIKNNEKTIRLGNRLWVLCDDLVISINGKVYKVPKGFVTDGASCPRILWALCSPVAGPFGQGAILHDWLYNVESPLVPRFVADLMLYYIGRYRKANIIRAILVKWGVNLFGWLHYKKDRPKITSKTCYDCDDAKRIITEIQGGYYGMVSKII